MRWWNCGSIFRSFENILPSVSMGKNENVNPWAAQSIQFELNSGDLSGMASDPFDKASIKPDQSVHEKMSSPSVPGAGTSTPQPRNGQQPEPLTDAYGLRGLLQFHEEAGREPYKRLLIHGAEPVTFLSNYNSREEILSTFGGALANEPLGLHDAFDDAPTEYRFPFGIKLRSPLDLDEYSLDTLFYLFYYAHGTIMQEFAADRLFRRGWRFHKQDQVWLRFMTDNIVTIFDPITWRQVQSEKKFIHPNDLEQRIPRISLPTNL